MSIGNNTYARIAGNPLKRFGADEKGATAIEYALICSLICVVIIVGLNTLGTELNVVFNEVTTALK